MTTVLIEMQYLPPVAYFSALWKADKVIIEAHEHFVKQTYRNRCQILTATKVLSLPVPVHHQGKKIMIRDLEIDYVQKWQNNHWRSIETAYRNAPFFDYYADPIREIIYSNSATLFDLDSQLLTLCLDFLGIDTPLEYSEVYQKVPETGVIDLRSAIHPKKPIAGLADFNPQPYHQNFTQVFGKDFVPNLSILDLLFCEGPNSLEVIKNSVRIS